MIGGDWGIWIPHRKWAVYPDAMIYSKKEKTSPGCSLARHGPSVWKTLRQSHFTEGTLPMQGDEIHLG
jgi:hypothetical protein